MSRGGILISAWLWSGNTFTQPSTPEPEGTEIGLERFSNGKGQRSSFNPNPTVALGSFVSGKAFEANQNPAEQMGVSFGFRTQTGHDSKKKAQSKMGGRRGSSGVGLVGGYMRHDVMSDAFLLRCSESQMWKNKTAERVAVWAIQ
ncbi:hypothetical protein FB45DRAFT_999965 [Roridomyces roridus]|uniref:Uncharacterized protein n=1 Tax=Roridomyces roridus TaxID=1738132 RepID=A0AAD7FWD3_9AGAR|nr:hypothetical protein FB45DRAFT_999965 [Roridomyces roridus]